MRNLIVRRISTHIKKPIPFHLVPYEEQYETRDFKPNVNSYPKLLKEELDEIEFLTTNIKKYIQQNKELQRLTKNDISNKSDQ